MSQPDINGEILARGTEFQAAMDVDRLWASGAQAFVNPDVAMLIFREQNFFPGPDGVVQLAIKNVASVVLPTAVLREFHANLGAALAAANSANG